MATTGRDLRRFRAPDDLWERFGNAAKRSPDPEADMSKVLRQFCRWYAGDTGARLPERPDAEQAERPTPVEDRAQDADSSAD